MQTEVSIEIVDYHDGQKEIIKNASRFNVVVCGRRFGKTNLAKQLSVESIEKKVGIFLPTYKDLSKFWREIKLLFRDIISEKNEQLKEIYLFTGGSIDFWSTENPDSGRGREYDIVIVDETQKHRNLNYFWQNTLFPTLTKTRGQAWFFGTIDAPGSVFHKLFEKAQINEHWKAFTAPTSANPYIPKEEIEIAKQTLSDLTFQREYLAKWLRSDQEQLFITTNYTKQAKELKDSDWILLSFDNNYNPMVCNLCFLSWDKTSIHFHQTFKLANTQIDEFCDYLKVQLLNTIGDFDFRRLIITGDPNMKNRTASARSLFDTIKRSFGLPMSQFALVNHLSHANHRDYFNQALQRFDISVHPNNIDLIYDFDNVSMIEKINSQGEVKLEINKNRQTKDKEADALDTARYALQAFIYKFVMNEN